MSEHRGESAGMRAVFGLWVAVIAIGLVIMIAVPLTGR